MLIPVEGTEPNPDHFCANVVKGQTVHVKIDSDRATTVRVPDFAASADVSAGKVTEITFTANKTGLFEIVASDPAQHLAWFMVR